MVSRNNKEYFFKYYSPKSIKVVLENCSRKWSSPLEFNDPFDNQFDLHLDEDKEEIARQLSETLLKYVTNDDPVTNLLSPRMAEYIEYLRKVVKESGKQFSEEDLMRLREGSREGVRNADIMAPELNRSLHSKLADTSIFCMSESKDNLLMWAHYAENHTGAVIKFLNILEVDSPLDVAQAQEVKYSDTMPTLKNEDMFGFDNSISRIISHITLTKGMDWAYEKEWRIVSSMRDKNKKSEIIPFAPEEVGAVYLGCKMEPILRQEIIGITVSAYPKAEIYQAYKHEKEFSLKFEKVR